MLGMFLLTHPVSGRGEGDFKTWRLRAMNKMRISRWKKIWSGPNLSLPDLRESNHAKAKRARQGQVGGHLGYRVRQDWKLVRQHSWCTVSDNIWIGMLQLPLKSLHEHVSDSSQSELTVERYLSTRNIPYIKLLRADQLSVRNRFRLLFW